MQDRIRDVTPCRRATRLASLLTALLLGSALNVGHAQTSRLYTWGWNNAARLGDGTTTNRTLPVPLQNVSSGFLTQAIAIAAGNHHALAAKSDGTVWAWGYNANGQLGDGTLVNKLFPVQVSGLTNVIAVAAGEHHSVALKSDGTVWAWGLNTSRQLGDGTVVSRLTPVQVVGPSGIVAISSERRHNLALKSDGTVWAWGHNASGQLGNNTVATPANPIVIPNLTGVASISAGVNHSLALKTDGTAWAWGDNTYGQLGDGTELDRRIPTQIVGVNGVGFFTGAATLVGSGHHSLALKSDGTVWAWGRNHVGQLGNDSTTNSSTPVQTRNVGAIGFLTGVSSISAGWYHNLAVKSDGTAYAWGYNNTGQLGDGTGANRVTPVQIKGRASVGMFAGAQTSEGGEDFSLMLKSDGTVWAWGNSGLGSLGYASQFDSVTPVQVVGEGGLEPGSAFVAVSAGYQHGLALQQNGKVIAWGYSDNGQLGDGTYAQRSTPIVVLNEDASAPLTGVVAISAGGWHNLALASDGTLWSWGYGIYGQLGNGAALTRNLPVKVKGVGGVGLLSQVVTMSAGEYHNLALRSDGTVWAWGDNTYRELGDGTTTDRSTPVQVKGPGGVDFLTGIVAVAAGRRHSVALSSDGTVWAWGYNGSGQLGDGTLATRSYPQPVLGLSNVVAISAGEYHTLALKADGTVWSWGWNNYGILGDGTLTERNLPVQVMGKDGIGFLTGIVSIAAGRNNSAALGSDGTFYAWGHSNVGQIGDGTTNTSSPFSRLVPTQVKTPDGGAPLEGGVDISVGEDYCLALQGEGIVTGSVQLDNRLCAGIAINFEFRPVGGGALLLRTISAGPSGVFSFFDVPEGTYDIAAQARSYLRKVVPNITTSGGGNVLNLRFSLKGGDIVGDDIIDLFDLVALFDSYGALPGDDNWNEGVADLNCDQSVDLFDLVTLFNNYGEESDP